MPNFLARFMEKLFSLKKFSKVRIEQSVTENIRDFAEHNYPKEFAALLKGKIIDGTLVIDELTYQHYSSGGSYAYLKMNPPAIAGIVGSLHSHPSHNKFPSLADKQFFNKTGMVHIIVAYPFRKEDFVCYNLYGERIDSR